MANLFLILPSLGMKCSLTGNKMFPSWESIVPLLGTNMRLFYVICRTFEISIFVVITKNLSISQEFS